MEYHAPTYVFLEGFLSSYLLGLLVVAHPSVNPLVTVMTLLMLEEAHLWDAWVHLWHAHPEGVLSYWVTSLAMADPLSVLHHGTVKSDLLSIKNDE